MTEFDAKGSLHQYPREDREAGVEAGYLGETLGRPFGEPLPWFADGAEPNARQA